MSEKENPAGAPTGAPHSGPNDSGADGSGLSQHVSRETSEPGKSSPPKQNKRSSFYVYLAVLFGAAFLMLLLAYFVQQRNNDDALDNLRSSSSASRQELLENIQRLEQDNLDLLTQTKTLMAQLTDLQAENAELEVQLDAARNDPAIAEQKNRADVLTSFAILEQALRDKNYETAAKHVRALCQGELNLDLGLVNLDGSEYFYPAARLSEIIPLLEKEGALDPGEAAVPGANPSDG